MRYHFKTDLKNGLIRGVEVFSLSFIIQKIVDYVLSYLEFNILSAAIKTIFMILIYEAIRYQKYWHTWYIFGWVLSLFILSPIIEPLEIALNILGISWILIRRYF